jgi:putative ABC transport system permease protein
MFWRVLKQLFRASRGRLAIALIAVAAGSAVTTALLNLQWDAESKLSTEFRSLGANIVILPRHTVPATAAITPATGTMPESVMNAVAGGADTSRVSAAPYLYVVANISSGKQQPQPVLLAGTWLDKSQQMAPWWNLKGQPIASRTDESHCLIGNSVANTLHLSAGDHLALAYSGRSREFEISGIITAGSDEDNQVFANLSAVQKLAGLDGRIGVAQVSVTGSTQEISSVMNRFATQFPELDVRPVRQISEAEGQLIGRLRSLILAMVILILALTALCVLASMTALAMERRRDVGLMKAIGGSMSRIVAIFLTEAGALGLAGGIAGYAAGILLSQWIGKRAFDVAITARLEVLPLVVALMVGVALVGAAPLRLLGRVRPAEILRGE